MYLHVYALRIHIAHCVSLVSAVRDAAERTQSHLLLLAVEQPVLLVSGTGPGAQLLGVHEEVSRGRTRLLEVRLDVGLAAGLLTAQADFPHGQRGASSAEDTVQHGGDFVRVQRVKPLHDVGELKVLLQRGFLLVVVVAFWTADRGGVFGPGLRDAALAEVVLAWQLDGFIEHVQADGTQELLFKAVFPTFIHDFSQIQTADV